jgi:hypothetical protein
MHQIGILRKIIFVFGFALAVFGCASNKTILENGIIVLTAENVPDGVRLTLGNIPSETNYIAFIFNAEGENAHSLTTEFYDWYTDIGTSLEEFKKTRSLVCPFVQNGLIYTVTAYIKKDGSNSSALFKAATEIIPENGILFVPNGITLKLNETKTGAAFSAFPELSMDARNDIEAKYSYLINYKEGYQPAEGNFDSLVFDFSANLDEIQAELTPCNIKPYQRIKYNNITWVLNFCEAVLFNASL